MNINPLNSRFLIENNIKMPDKTQPMHFIIFNAFLSNFAVIPFFAKKSNFHIQAKIYKNTYSIPIDEKGPVRPSNWVSIIEPLFENCISIKSTKQPHVIHQPWYCYLYFLLYLLYSHLLEMQSLLSSYILKYAEARNQEQQDISK